MSDLPTGAVDSDDSGEAEVPTTASPALVAKSAYGYTNGNLTSIDNTNNNSDPALRTIDDFSWAYVQGPGLPDSDSAEPLSNTGDSLLLANAATIPGGSSLPAWEVSSFTSSVDGTATYNYDADAQLRGTIYTGPTPGANYTGSPSDESYLYDDAGNRTNVDGTTTDVGPFNEVLKDGTYTYQYDADGDLIRETSANGDYTVFAYDNRDRMTSATLYTVTSPSSTDGVLAERIQYKYDVFNNMIARTETDYTGGVAGTSTTQEFVYAGPQSNGQIALTFLTSGAAAPTMSNVTDRYLWGPAVDQILADDRTGSVAEDAILWTIDDNQNTVRDVVDSSGNPLDHITYSAYGVPLSPPAGSNAAAFGTIFGYTGAYTDPTTGLQNRVDRVYDPLTGTFTTPDPAQADANSKRYAGNDPTSEVDRDGLEDNQQEPSNGAGQAQQPPVGFEQWRQAVDAIARLESYLTVIRVQMDEFQGELTARYGEHPSLTPGSPDELRFQALIAQRLDAKDALKNISEALPYFNAATLRYAQKHGSDFERQLATDALKLLAYDGVFYQQALELLSINEMAAARRAGEVEVERVRQAQQQQFLFNMAVLFATAPLAYGGGATLGVGFGGRQAALFGVREGASVATVERAAALNTAARNLFQKVETAGTPAAAREEVGRFLTEAAQVLRENPGVVVNQPALSRIAPSNLPRTARYGDMAGTLDEGVQANHLNQNAAFKSVIPEADGAAVAMRGNAFTEVGSPHYEFHRSLEQFWNQYRPGGALAGTRPTNAQYGQAVDQALRAAGYSQQEAASLAAQAAANRAAFGLSETGLVPRIPGRLPQRVP